MTINKREHRLGGEAGSGMPISDVVRVAIANTTRSGHGIDTAAPKYGDQLPVHLHQGEIPASEIDAGLRGHPHDLKQTKDTR